MVAMSKPAIRSLTDAHETLEALAQLGERAGREATVTSIHTTALLIAGMREALSRIDALDDWVKYPPENRDGSQHYPEPFQIQDALGEVMFLMRHCLERVAQDSRATRVHTLDLEPLT